MKLKKLAQVVSLICIAGPVAAQSTTPAPVTAPQKVEKIEITGSSIKRVQEETALPLQIITREEMERQGIVTAEQLILMLDSNGNGLDNLASNSDVVAGQARGNNGATAANLRGQGSAATLILLNGRRIAAHGLNGGTVDLNSIPFAAVERVEVLKDGASAIYGTDAIGGVINFILKKDFKGITMQAFHDKTEQGGGDISRVSIVGGMGDLAKDGYNVMASLAHSENKLLRGDQRDFVNTFQPNRGLSVDTRGTPFATAFPLNVRTILSSRNAAGALTNNLGPTQPGTTVAMSGGINALDLPGQPGCNSIADQQAYDELLWATPNARWACAWDTGRAAAIQQPVKNTNFVSRGSINLGSTATAYVEATGSKVVSAKSFSNNQISSSNVTTNPFFNLLYPSTGSSYNYVFNSLVALFPTIEENRGQGIAFRWRCMECGRRELETTAKTNRFLLGVDGTFKSWDYRVGLSRAESDTRSVIGGGYYYDDLFVPLIRNGILNPFVLPGQTQTAAAIAGLAAASAKGVTLYGGKFTLEQADVSSSGSIWTLPAGDLMAAVGVDSRREKYSFQGDQRALADQRAIFNVPFDNANALGGVKRTVKAIYGELLIPLHKNLELTAAVRRDDYSGFGATTNPKISMKFTPTPEFMVRAGYNTGFRVPSFNQLFNGVTQSQFTGATLVDFSKCPAGVVSATPGCESIRPVIFTGGKPDLGPEEASQYTYGFVWAPLKNFSMNVDFWQIDRDGTIQFLDLTTLSRNFALFPERFGRDASGNLVAIDQRNINAGQSTTSGVEIGMRHSGAVWRGKYDLRFDGTYLIEKRSRLIASAAYGPSEIDTFTRSGDLGLRWKHTGSATYTEGNWSGTLTHQYRTGYTDFVLPGVANGTVRPANYDPTVEAYQLIHASVTYRGFKNLRITGGIKNLLNTDPPFTVAYDSNTGAGSSWEPRVADPRGRSYTILINYDFR